MPLDSGPNDWIAPSGSAAAAGHLHPVPQQPPGEPQEGQDDWIVPGHLAEADDWITPPEPGFLSSLGAAAKAGVTEDIRNVAGLPNTLRGKPQAEQPQETFQEPLTLGDLVHPTRALPKITYQLAGSGSTLGAGIAGGIAGEAVAPEGGGLVGGAAAAGAMTALNQLTPLFAEEMRKPGADPDRAFNAALERAGQAGLFSGAGWAAFGVRFFAGPVKNLLFQAFGVQPGMAVAEKGAENVEQGKPLTEGMGSAALNAAVGTAVPMAGHAAVAHGAGLLRDRGAAPEPAAETPAAAAAAPQPAPPARDVGHAPAPEVAQGTAGVTDVTGVTGLPQQVLAQAQRAGQGAALASAFSPVEREMLREAGIGPTLDAAGRATIDTAPLLAEAARRQQAGQWDAKLPADDQSHIAAWTPRQAASVPPTTPESAKDIAAQIGAMVDPTTKKDSVFVAAGNGREIPDQLPHGVRVVERPEGTLLTTSPEKAAQFRMASTLTDAHMAELLGYPESKPEAIASGQPMVVEAKQPDGAVAASTLASPAGVPAAEAALAAQAAAGAAIEVKSPVEAQGERAEAHQGPPAAQNYHEDQAQEPNQAENAQKVANQGPESASGAQNQSIVEHVTKKGKTLRGVVRSDLTAEQAKAIDQYAFKRPDGWFIRESALAKARPEDIAPAPAPEIAPDGKPNDWVAPEQQPAAAPPVTPQNMKDSGAAPVPAAYGTGNKVFTASAADAARARLREKMNRLNAGLDPEMMVDGAMLAGFHIEAGARRFADYAHAMVSDLGEAVRPYLRSFYESVRHYPGFDAAGMSSHDDIEAQLRRTPEQPTSTPEETGNGVQGAVRPGDAGAGARDVHATPPGGETGGAPPGEIGGGARPPETNAGRPAEEQPRGADTRGGEAGRGGREGDADRISGAARPGDAGAAGRPAPDANVRGENFRIEPGALDEARSPRTKARDNLAAIELAKRLIADAREATVAEQAVLAKYVGWGGLPGAFEHPRTGKFGAGLEDVGHRLREVLSGEEHAEARQSTQYAHYTAEHVIRSMWDAVRGMGFKGGEVLEPGMGVGHFLGLMPPDIAERSAYQGIERDSITAQIAKLLYPKSGVREADFTTAPIPEQHFDLVIGNPPFSGTIVQADPKYAANRFMLHDYFFAKSIDSVRPGGLLAFVTSAGTMNKMDASARRYLAERADFVGGVRLPSTAFKRNAGTEVTTDILFFKRHPEGQLDLPEGRAPDWAETVRRNLKDRDGNQVTANVNRYFSEHPEQVLGEEGMFDKLVAGERYAVRQAPGSDLAADLGAALGRLPKDVMTERETPRQRAETDFDSGQVKDGSFYVKDGALMQYRGGVGRAAPLRGQEAGALTRAEVEQVKALVPVRDALRDVMAANLRHDDEAGAKARDALNAHYDRFVQQYGPINRVVRTYRRPSLVEQESARSKAREQARDAGDAFNDGDFNPTELLNKKATLAQIAKARQAAREDSARSKRQFAEGTFDAGDMPDVVMERFPNIRAFMPDPESYRLRSIERYDDSTDTASKKAVFDRNILADIPEPQIKSAEDGVLWSLNQMGRFDLDAIAKKMGKPPGDIVGELGDKVFKVPGTDGTFQTSDEYLSGDVVSKLEQARALVTRDPEIQRNIDALEKAVPRPLSPGEIKAEVGMPWVPRELVNEFVSEHLRVGAPKIDYAPAIGSWIVSEHGGRWGVERPDFAKWSTSDRDAYEALSDAMNRISPKVYRTGLDRKQVFDPVATQAAQDKVDAIKQEWRDWLGADVARGDAMAKAYNDKLNRVVSRSYDGSYLTTPGVSAGWSWRPHQTRVVARIVQSGNTYMAHAVGAGKTSAMIGAGMEMRRLGLVNKPMYVVPNHMLGQFAKEFYEQYPTARIAVADDHNFHTDTRKQFVSNIAQDDLDAVIITHSGFEKIPISDRFGRHLLEEQISELQDALAGLDKQQDRITVKKLEAAKERLEQKLKEMAGGNKDQTITFDESGVDFLFVDEAHEFRKLSFATKMGQMKGVTPEGSDMAWDLYGKVRYLDNQRPGRSAVFASGTPITNTMGELYSLSRFLQPDELRKYGVSHFDSWVQSFADTKTVLEQTPAGTYAPTTRLSTFMNMPELFKMVAQVMDVVTDDQLGHYVTRPTLKGGERQFHLAPRTAEVDAYQRVLADRVAAIKARTGPPKPGDDIILSVINDGRHASIDPRFVEMAQNDPRSKLNEMLANVVRIHNESADTQFMDPASGYTKPAFRGPATQMIFANLGVNERGPMGFGGYKWMKTYLKRAGIPDNEVAFIGDYKSHIARQRLFNDMNDGKVRILIGSTQKMGTGVNAQRRLIAIHNQDPLWYPADDKQRNGRGIRQGNFNPQIEVHDYSTKGTYDAVMWDMMGRKGRFIQQFFEGDPNLRSMEDLGEASMYEQAAGMATTDPRIKELTDLRQRLELAERRSLAHDREQYEKRRSLGYAQDAVEYYGSAAAKFDDDIRQRQDTGGDKFRMTVAGDEFTKRKDAGKALADAVNAALPEMQVNAKERTLGEIGGFQVQLRKGVGSTADLTIRLSNGGEPLSAGGEGGAGVIQSAEYVLRNLENYRDASLRKVSENNAKAGSLRRLTGQQFAGQPEIDDLRGQVRTLEDTLKAEAAAAAAGTAPPAPLDDNAPRMARTVPLYSAVQRAVDGLKQAKGTGEQMLAQIAKTPGVKPEEVKWLGLDEWLRGQKSVTREQIADYVRANAIDVREVMKGGEADPGTAAGSPAGWGSVGGGTRYAEHSLPGGQNYRELLLTLPLKPDASNLYISSHWDEGNVLAHVRFNDRTSPDGKRVLHVEEVQSDWHQAGRKKGYRSDAPGRNGQVQPQANGSWKIEWDDGTFSGDYDSAASARAAMPGRATLNAVPNAPFKTTWPTLAMRRIIKYAVDSGYDRVTWTPGEQQAERYDLSKQVAELYHWPEDSGFTGLSAYGRDGSTILDQHVVANDELDGVVGKEMAERILSGAGRHPAGHEPEVRLIEGDGLKVGGEGMKGFYDKILPTETQKIVGKFGAKVGRSDINLGEADTFEKDRYHEQHGHFPDEDAIQSVHGFDITPQMRQAVGAQGLPLFARPLPVSRSARLDAVAERPEPLRAPKVPQPHPAAVQALFDAAQSGVKVAGPHVQIEVQPAGTLEVRNPDGSMGHASGYALGRLIRAALTPGLPNTINHEAVHALRNLGVIKGAEWDTLVDAARRGKWAERYDIPRVYADQPHLHDEEAIAHRFADWQTGAIVAPSGALARIWQHVQAFFARARGLLQGRGFQNADDVFGRMGAGEIGAREPGSQAPMLGPQSAEESLRVAAKWEPALSRRLAEQATGTDSQPAYARAVGAAMAPNQKDRLQTARDAVDEVKKWFAPTSRAGAKPMEYAVRKHAAELAQSTARSISALDRIRMQVGRLPRAVQLDIWHRAETGARQPTPELQMTMDAVRAQLDHWTAKIQSLGKGHLEQARENYMGRIWGNYREWVASQPAPTEKEMQSRAVAAGMGKSPLAGSGNFLKQRTFDTLAEGMAAGLVPATHNPVEMQLLKLREMQKFYHGQRMADEIKATGLAKWVPYYQEGEARSAGLTPLDDRIFKPRFFKEGTFGRVEPGNWYAPEPAARVFNNYIQAGIAREFPTVYGAVRAANNALNSAQLGLSGFHATFIANDMMTSRVALAIQQAMRGEVGRAVRTTASFPAAPVTTYRRGAALERAYLDPDNATPEMRRLAQAMTLGGGRATMERWYQTADAGTFFKHLGDLKHPESALHESWEMLKNSPLKAVFQIVGRIMDTIVQPLMGHLVPKAKMGVFADLAQDWLRRNPTASEDETAAAMTRFWDSVDNRMGQMVHDNVFWTRTQKDIAFLSTRSVGWNLGTIREIGGGAVDGMKLVADMARGRKTDLTSRTAYVMAMPLVTGLFGATLTYLSTGEAPDSIWDYFFPPTGTETNGVKDRRIIPGYIKDVIEYAHAPVQTLLNKTSPLFETLSEVARNKDYYGGTIYAHGIDNPFVAYPEFLANQMLPFSIRSWLKEQKSGATMLDQALAFWGIQPAPASIANPQRTEAFELRDEMRGVRAREKENARGRLSFQ